MKKLFLLGIALAGVTSVQAQNRTIRAEVGLNVSTTATIINQGASIVPSALVGPKIGATVEYDLSHKYKLGGLLNTYFAPGVYYKTSGFDIKSTPQKRDLLPSSLPSHGSLKVHYLSVPLNVGTRIPISKSASVSLEFGPTLSYALSGEMTGEADRDKGTTYKTDIFSTEGSDKPNRFELGWGSSLAIEFNNKFYIRSTVEGALTDLASQSVDGVSTKMRNSNVSFSVGYRF